LLIVLAATIVLGLPALAQAQGQPSAPDPSGAARSWTPRLTADGQPDIQGVWTNFDPTPFEAPSDDDVRRLAALRR
jgi:hypothetical protein